MRSLALKPIFRLVAGVLAALLFLGVTACGESTNTDANSTSSDKISSSTDADETEQPEESESNSPTPDLTQTPESLDEFVELLRPEIAAELERYDDIYSDFQLRAEDGNTLVYEYTFIDKVDPAQAEEQSEATEQMLVSMAAPILEELKAVGVEDPHVRWVYLNPDGSELFRVDQP